MAVPKQKQSHCRTNKRRSQHKISPPTSDAARTAARRACRIVSARTAAPTPAARSSCSAGRRRRRTTRAVIALDANGADQGPGRRRRGRPRSGVDVQLFGPRRRARRRRRRRRRRRARRRSRTTRSRRWRFARSRTPRSSRPPRAVADGRADALVSAGPTGADARRAVLHVKRIRGVHRPASPCCSRPGRRPRCCSTPAPTWRCAPSTSSSSPTWARLHGGRPRRRAPARRPAVDRRGGRRRARPTSSRRTSGWRSGTLDFVGNVEGSDVSARRADVVVTDGFTGNVALKLMEGTVAVSSARSATRSARARSRRSAGLLIRGRVGSCATQIDPNTVGGAILLGVRKPVVIAHGSFGAEGIANAVRLAQRAVDERMVEKTAAAWSPRASCGPRPLLASLRPMNRDEVLELHPRPPGRRARGRPIAHPGRHPLQGGPRGRLAGPRRAGRRSSRTATASASPTRTPRRS